MKQLEFFYQEAQIHFLVHGTEKGVMINATEMAKAYGKRTGNYLANQSTVALVNALKRTDKSARIIDNRGRNGIYFCEDLAIDFAMWLDVKFRVWVSKTIREITFGKYRKHAQAEEMQIKAEKEMDELKKVLLSNPDTETARKYFEAQERRQTAKNLKSRVLRSDQLDLFTIS